MERTWETCIAFHGHPCPVLATGYRASVEALRILHITDLHREKLACIAENQVCGVDAVQIMLNCTLAKGNIIIRNHGKQVYTVIRLSDGKAVRLSLNSLSSVHIRRNVGNDPQSTGQILHHYVHCLPD